MILVFDLDDTLYDEIAFVYSGFNAVSKYLSLQFSLNEKKILISLKHDLKNHGRGKVFDNILQENNIYTKKLVKKCISVYRSHKPNIKITNQTEDVLKSLNLYNKYIVTDGNKIVQKNKIKALKIGHHFKKIYITHNYGIKNSKPSTYCFHKILDDEKILDKKKLVYIGDNPYKDFVNLKNEGFKTIRIINGHYKDIRLEKKFEAHYTIKELNDIQKILKLVEK